MIDRFMWISMQVTSDISWFQPICITMGLPTWDIITFGQYLYRFCWHLYNAYRRSNYGMCNTYLYVHVTILYHHCMWLSRVKNEINSHKVTTDAITTNEYYFYYHKHFEIGAFEFFYLRKSLCADLWSDLLTLNQTNNLIPYSNTG